MKKYSWILFAALLAAAFSSAAADPADDILGQAYQLVVSEKMEEAKALFAKAADTAFQSGNERAVIESVRGLYVLGAQEAAMAYAEKALEAMPSWKAACGIGYIYASVKGMTGKAGEAFSASYRLASNRGDFYGMAESAKAMFRIGRKNDALGYLEAAEKVAQVQKAFPRMKIISEAYREMGEMQKASSVEATMSSLSAPRPSVIDTVPGDSAISAEAQQARSAQIEKEVEADNDYIAAKAMAEKEKEYYGEWMVCTPYFTYLLFDASDDSGYDSLAPDVVIAPAFVTAWANRSLRHYSRSTGGSYIYVNTR